jgi:FkbM family methyltransferase
MRAFHPAFSPRSCYLLRDEVEEAYFAKHGGAPEARLIEWATQLIRPDQSFIDVGAHIGSWTQHFAQKCKRVYAFEPQSTTYARLCGGVQLAAFQNVFCYDVAIGGRGEVDLHVISADGGGSTLRHRSELLPALAIERVRAVQLDDYAFEDVGLIKIDAEGAEADILRGATKTLEAHGYPALLLEAWQHDWYASERAALIAQVEAIGYHVRPVAGWPEMLVADHADHADHAPKSVSVAAERPLLGLVMIVKNEARRITEVLASYQPYIDAWTILDTGSTDGTQDLIRRTLDGIPGGLHEEPFVDFATSRNRALELHGTSTVFSIMPNGDVLSGGAELVSFLEVHRSNRAGAYRARISPGHYYHPLVMRCGAGWRYKWRTHECAMGPNLGPQIPGVTVVRDRGSRTDAEWRQRWMRDLDLLNRDRADDPADPRPYFYLGQTHECLGQHAQALAFFERRTELGGYFDEVYEAKFRVAKMKAALDRPWPEVQDAYLAAHALDPRRAEPLHAIAEHWHNQEEHALTRLFAVPAADLPKPPTDLFLDEEVYRWRAADLAAISSYYTGRKESGRCLAEIAVRGNPDDERLRANRAYFAQRADALFGSTIRPIDFKPEPDWNASNPSIYRGHFGLRCIVRTVNYKIVDDKYVTPPQDIVSDGSRWQGWQLIHTRNFLLSLDDNFKTTQVVELIDKTGIDRTSYPVHGFEDARLFEWRGKWWATATVCDFTDDGRREIALLELDLDGAVVRAEPLRGHWSVQAQKNWMPLIDGEAAKFVYATSPSPVIFDLVEERGNHVIDPGKPVIPNHGRLRGGSQGVRVDGGWLFVVHDVAIPGDGRLYLHRFVLLNEQLELVSMSDPFYFERLGIEFCAGLAEVEGKLVASYAVNDGAARLAIFDWERVRGALRADFVI